MFAFTALFVLAQSASDEGLTLREIIDSLPTDPVSVFTLVFVLSCLGLVLWYGGRPGGKGGRPA